MLAPTSVNTWKAAMYAMAARAAEVAVAASAVDTVKVRAAGAVMVALAATAFETARVERAAQVVMTTTAAIDVDTMGVSDAVMNTSQVLQTTHTYTSNDANNYYPKRLTVLGQTVRA